MSISLSWLKINREVFLIITYLLNAFLIIVIELIILPEHILINVQYPLRYGVVFLVLQFIWLPLILSPIYGAFYECFCED